MIAAITLFLGWCLLFAIIIPLCTYGMIAFSLHSSKCHCSGCVRRREKLQARRDRIFPHPAGAVMKTYEEWEREWEEENEPSAWSAE